jgi:tetratricopeptide (TPR) repeat protein
LRGLPLLAALLVVLASATVYAQEDSVELKARTHFAAGEYKQAADIYAQLYAQTLHPTYLRNIGRCYQNMGEPDKAISSFREYLRKAENLSSKHRAEVEGYIREMEELKRTREAPRPAAVAPATSPAPPPAPSLAATDPADNSNRVEASLNDDVASPEADEASPIYTRWWFWTGIGAVAAGGVVTAIILSSGGTPTADTTLGTMPAKPQ